MLTQNSIKKVYRSDIDLLKGFAILAVVFYHMGIFLIAVILALMHFWLLMAF